MVYSSLQATYACNDGPVQILGTAYERKTIEYSSRFLAYGTLSSPDQRCDENVVVDGFHTIDFSYLFYHPITTSMTTKAGCPPYVNPRLSMPADLTDVEPAWETCQPLYYGAFDPPRVLTKVTGPLVPLPAAHEPASTPAPALEPMVTENQPAVAAVNQATQGPPVPAIPSPTVMPLSPSQTPPAAVLSVKNSALANSDLSPSDVADQPGRSAAHADTDYRPMSDPPEHSSGGSFSPDLLLDPIAAAPLPARPSKSGIHPAPPASTDGPLSMSDSRNVGPKPLLVVPAAASASMTASMPLQSSPVVASSNDLEIQIESPQESQSQPNNIQGHKTMPGSGREGMVFAPVDDTTFSTAPIIIEPPGSELVVSKASVIGDSSPGYANLIIGGLAGNDPMHNEPETSARGGDDPESSTAYSVVVVNPVSSTNALYQAVPETPMPLVIGTHVAQLAPSGSIIIASQTLGPGQETIIEGTPISVGSSQLVIDSTTHIFNPGVFTSSNSPTSPSTPVVTILDEDHVMPDPTATTGAPQGLSQDQLFEVGSFLVTRTDAVYRLSSIPTANENLVDPITLSYLATKNGSTVTEAVTIALDVGPESTAKSHSNPSGIKITSKLPSSQGLTSNAAVTEQASRTRNTQGFVTRTSTPINEATPTTIPDWLAKYYILMAGVFYLPILLFFIT